MPKIQYGVAPEDFNQSAKRTLFVEGDLDESCLKELLKKNNLALSVKKLGKASDIMAVARSLYEYHPEYYFLVDRDYETQEMVEKSWKSFPDPETQNILIWPKRELENYFIDPEYLKLALKSGENITLKPNKYIEVQLLKLAKQRLVSDAINIVMRKLKVSVKQQFVDDLWNPQHNYTDKNLESKIGEYIQKIKALYGTQVEPQLDVSKIMNQYAQLKQAMLGEGQTELAIGQGTWLDDISGKEIFAQLVNNCFTVKDQDDNEILDLREKQKFIIKALLSLDETSQPEDFQRLLKILREKL